MALKRRHFCKSSGFTIIELIIVLAIMSVVAGIGVPSYLSYIPKSRLNGAATTLYGDLMSARMKAVKTSRRTQVVFIDSRQYRINDDADDNGTVNDPEGDAILKNIQDEYSGVTFSSTGNPIFTPRGTASNWATITLSNPSGSKQITVSITGVVRIL